MVDASIRNLSLYKAHGIELSDPRRLFEILQKQLTDVGIFSLSDCPDNQPMWAHYAGNHTGLALGFSAAEGSKLADTRHTLPVTYSAEKPKFDEGFLHEIRISAAPHNGTVSESRFSFDDPVFRASISIRTGVAVRRRNGEIT